MSADDALLSKDDTPSTASIAGFIKKGLLLPIGILLQLIGYAESVHKLVGLPAPFVFATAGFLLTVAGLVWLIWFSESGLWTRQAGFGFLAFITIGYIFLVQFQLMSWTERNTINTLIEVESARSLVSQFPTEAVRRISPIMDRGVEVSEVYNIRGVAYSKLGKNQEALQDFQAAAKLDPMNPLYQYNQAAALRDMCDYSASNEVLEAYLKQYKSNMWARYDHGVVNQILGHNDVALADYNIVIDSRQDLPMQSALFNSAVIYAAAAAAAAGNGVERANALAKMFSLLDHSIKLNPVTRLADLKEAMVPIEKREPRCSGKYYVTDDLTVVSNFPEFKDWLKQYEQR
jgi:tetratricopeptide (TPR) repeat protein